jgi:predicted transposase YbfD/YdcC
MTPKRSPIIRHFSKLEDPRRDDRKTKHKLLDVIVIAICASLCGIDNFEGMSFWAKSKEAWLRQFLELPHGIPSHDTINRIFAKINPKLFQACFLDWIHEIAELCAGTVVAIDGKTLRRSFDKASAKSALHMVSAWATANRLVLGQTAVEDKSNEITAIPKLLESLDIRGCLITIDAIGTQRDIADKIVATKADYTLALKGNQKSLHRDVVDAFARLDPKILDAKELRSTVDRGHGRKELRQYFLINDVAEIQAKHEWPGLASIGMVRSIRLADKATVEQRYYINSYADDIQRFAAAVRGHWGIESLHWQLDVSMFNEDQSRVRKDHAPENLAVLRRTAVNLLSKDKDKLSTTKKMMRCMFDHEHIAKILAL